MKRKVQSSNRLWSVVMTIVCVIYTYPIFMVPMKSCSGARLPGNSRSVFRSRDFLLYCILRIR